MKRRLAWLALPIVLFAVTWGVKWRADHPTPTKKDLAVRALMSQSVEGVVTYYPFIPNSPNNPSATLQPIDLRPFTESFYLSPPTPKNTLVPRSPGSLVFTYFLQGQSVAISTRINIQAHRGIVIFDLLGKQEEYQLRPLTVKRWIELLLSNPRITPELRKQLNN